MDCFFSEIERDAGDVSPGRSTWHDREGGSDRNTVNQGGKPNWKQSYHGWVDCKSNRDYESGGLFPIRDRDKFTVI
jgi:hypothetical protein